MNRVPRKTGCYLVFVILQLHWVKAWQHRLKRHLGLVVVETGEARRSLVKEATKILEEETASQDPEQMLASRSREVETAQENAEKASATKTRMTHVVMKSLGDKAEDVQAQKRQKATEARRARNRERAERLRMIGEDRCRNETGTGPFEGITMLTTLPYVPGNNLSSEHLNETLIALAENCKSEAVTEIRVVLDHHHDDDLHATRALQESVLARVVELSMRQAVRASARRWKPANEYEVAKIKVHVYGRQPTYSDMFRYASHHLRGRIVALANADIVLRNLRLVDADTLRSQKLALVLSVRPPTPGSGPLPLICHKAVFNRCDNWYTGGSWDCEIFYSPLTNPRYYLLDEREPRPVYMNQNGAENRALQYDFTLS